MSRHQRTIGWCRNGLQAMAIRSGDTRSSWHAWALLLFVWATLAIPIETPADDVSQSAEPVPIDQAALMDSEVTHFEGLNSYARQIASKPYTAEPALDASLAGLSYEQYRDIRFRNGRSTWNDGQHPFWLEYFHRGFVQTDRVEVFVIRRQPTRATKTPPTQTGRPKNVVPIPYDREYFDFLGQAEGLRPSNDTGFAGIRIAGRFRPGGDSQELLSFVGSSYFRSRTAETVYGASARALAIDIGLDRDEEFPDFRKFWLVEPAPTDTSMVVLALMDGPSVVGAYEFTLHAGTQTTRLEVRAAIHFRHVPAKVAMAPITSMWMWGDGLAGPPKDARPHVHDSDGLRLIADGIHRWRALTRTSYPSVSATTVESLQGFGLMQRNRDFADYQDTGALYHQRPSIWVEPLRPWGPGRVELLELPGAHEGIDNVGAYFVPDEPPSADQPLRLRYRMWFFGDPERMTSKVQQWAESPAWCCVDLDVKRDAGLGTLTIRFDANEPEVRPATTDVELLRGELVSRQMRMLGDGRAELTLKIRPSDSLPVEVRCQLRTEDGETCSELVEYLLPVTEPSFVYPDVYTRQESAKESDTAGP